MEILQVFKRINKSMVRLVRTGYQMILSWLRWRYVKLLTIGLDQVHQPSIDDLHVVYKSENFIVINKHSYLKINSDSPSDKVTVATQIAKKFPLCIDTTKVHGFSFVHRLDYSTSGVLCVALTPKSSRWGHCAFQKKYVTKHYIAVVRGFVQEEMIHIDAGIGEDSSILDVHKMCTDDSPQCHKPRPAQTTMYLMQRGLYDKEPVSKLLLVPHTGRTHQLRVHCAHIGHRIVGDYTYSDRSDIYPSRMMLHAYRLIVPMKREHIDCVAPDPFTKQEDSRLELTETIATYDELLEKHQLIRPQDLNLPCGVKTLLPVVSKKKKKQQNPASAQNSECEVRTMEQMCSNAS